MARRFLRARFSATAVAVLLAGSQAAAQQRALTLDDIYDPSTRINFSGTTVGELVWIDDARYARARSADLTWFAVDAASNTERPLFDTDAMISALSRAPGVS